MGAFEYTAVDPAGKQHHGVLGLLEIDLQSRGLFLPAIAHGDVLGAERPQFQIRLDRRVGVLHSGCWARVRRFRGATAIHPEGSSPEEGHHPHFRVLGLNPAPWRCCPRLSHLASLLPTRSP